MKVISNCFKCPEYLCTDYSEKYSKDKGSIKYLFGPPKLITGATFAVAGPCINTPFAFTVYINSNNTYCNTYPTLKDALYFLLNEFEDLTLEDRLQLIKANNEMEGAC